MTTRDAQYDELHEAHEAVEEARLAYKAAADRRRAAALSLGITYRQLSAELGIAPSTASAMLKAARVGKLDPTVHSRKRKASSTPVPTLNLVTGAESADPSAELDEPRMVGATF
ncbi:hypothetical protein [uncultured Friedmanniella sp.]|uniref:hypothetical protein n=1 Tax=uncultured Friedmanniella sp. TaxID=335381 RepID=UPI0035CB647D